MRITKSICDRILNSFPIPPPENGGILGMKNGAICEYHHDNSVIITEQAVYEPNTVMLNQKILEWSNQGVQFVGIIHSHMVGQETLSKGDIEYITTVFGVAPEWIGELYFPIVIPETGRIISYIAKRNEKSVIIQRDDMQIIL